MCTVTYVFNTVKLSRRRLLCDIWENILLWFGNILLALCSNVCSLVECVLCVSLLILMPKSVTYFTKDSSLKVN
jgi:hypothetical protein